MQVSLGGATEKDGGLGASTTVSPLSRLPDEERACNRLLHKGLEKHIAGFSEGKSIRISCSRRIREIFVYILPH